MNIHDNFVRPAELRVKSAITNINPAFEQAGSPITAPPNATPGQLLVLGLRGSKDTDPVAVIARIRREAKGEYKAALAHIDEAGAASSWLADTAGCVKSGHMFHEAPDSIPPHIVQHIHLLKSYADAGVVVRAEVAGALLNAGTKGLARVREAKENFKRFEYTLLIALNKQSAKYARLWGREHMANGYDKRAERLSKKYRIWAAANKGIDA